MYDGLMQDRAFINVPKTHETWLQKTPTIADDDHRVYNICLCMLLSAKET